MALKKAKDLYRCVRSIESFTDGQVRVLNWDSDRLSYVTVEIKPNCGIYRGGKFVFRFNLPESFPQTRPYVSCKTWIYHPNIDPTCISDYDEEEDEDEEDYGTTEDNVCLNLFDEWQSTFGLDDCIQGVLFLMDNPNLEDPLSPLFDSTMEEDEFTQNVKRSLRGESIDGYDFPYNYEMTEEEKQTQEIVDNVIDGLLIHVFETCGVPEDTIETEIKDCNSNDVNCEHVDDVVEDETKTAVIDNETDTSTPECETENEMNNNDSIKDNTDTENDGNENDNKEVQPEKTIENLTKDEMLQKVEELIDKFEACEPEVEERAEESEETPSLPRTQSVINVSTLAHEDLISVSDTIRSLVETVSENVESEAQTDDAINSENVQNNDNDSSQNACSSNVYARQSSKIIKADNAIDDLDEQKDSGNAESMKNDTEIKTVEHVQNGDWYLTNCCTFVAPDYDFMLNLVGAACYQVVKSVVR